jgi:capsid protein
MVYGLKYRIDSARGIPLITAVMETAAKMGRYREAVIGTAEELSKITYQIKHEAFSTGESPVINSITQANGFANPGLPTDSFGVELANKVAVSTNKQTFNMTPGSSIEPVSKGDGELMFRDFYEVNFDLVCAVAGYPPEVIMSKYNSNYSSSRAAIKDFEHTLNVKRNKFAAQFYQLVYNFCLDVWVLQGKVKLEGYREALLSQDEMALAAYRTVRWAGDNVPHIDPFKEVQAIRAMLPKDMENMPLITFEQAAEMLGGGDFDDVLEQFKKEWDLGQKMGVEKAEKTSNQNPVQPNGNPAKKKESE